MLTNTRFLAAFYENLCNNPEENSNNLAFLEDCLAICEDSFYPPLVPDYDWDYARFRLLEYYAIATDYHNARGFDAEQFRSSATRRRSSGSSGMRTRRGTASLTTSAT